MSSPSLITPIRRADVRGPKLYAGFRDDLRRRVIEHKRPRRVSVGDRVTLVFENRHTLLFQIEEMLRAESILEEDKIAEEIAVYNALMPDERSLSATLLVELAPDADARRELGRLVGLDEHVVLHVGPHALRAAFEPGRSDGERISAVQYLRFPLTPAARMALFQPETLVTLEIDHPNYQHRTVCGPETRASLAADYGG
jgi:hypothetical protein